MTQGILHNWNECRLWNELLTRADGASGSVHLLLEYMPRIQTVLAKGGTSPLDFTLHDEQHGYRVSERAFEIIGSTVLPNLSQYEIALVILSAYLHDIGMSPEEKKVNFLTRYLVSGETIGMSKDLIEDFRFWLTNRDEDIVVPFSGKDINRAVFLVSQYCRFHHAEWSEEWIDFHLNQDFNEYPTWLSDLKVLCRSHDQGYDILTSDRFDPKIVGNGMIVHLRYLASVLRIADILDFDPERTPEPVFNHRSIHPKSLSYWIRDLSVNLLIESGRLTITAEPPNALIHKSIDDMIADVESELRLVRRLDDEKPFEIARFREKPLPHVWNLIPNVRKDIRPYQNRYEYIDGAFRPNLPRLLGLFSGSALYRDSMAPVRELIQNAFDAIREATAYERLAQPKPGDRSLEAKIAQVHSVKLGIQVLEDRVWLVCSDDGSGMTKQIIRDHFLVSGSVKRPDVLRLQSRCHDAGFELARTGRFGIGVLSYFMLADRVIVRTRRNSAADGEPIGWVFQTDGIDSFGELRIDQAVQPGTEVSLRLKEIIPEQALDWFERLKEYVLKLVVKAPCSTIISSNTKGAAGATLSYGWQGTPPVRLHKEWAQNEINYSYKDSLIRSKEDTSKREAGRSTRRRLSKSLDSAVSWRSFEGVLPDNLGSFRATIPIYLLPGGDTAPAYIEYDRPEDYSGMRSWDLGYGGPFNVVAFQGSYDTSYHGIQTSLELSESSQAEYRYWVGSPAIVEIDLENSDAGNLSLDRKSIKLTSQSDSSLRAFLSRGLMDAMAEFWHSQFSTRYSLLAESLTWNKVTIHRGEYWAQMDGPMIKWDQIHYPLAVPIMTFGQTDLSFPSSTSKLLRYRGQQVTVLPPIRAHRDATMRWDMESIQLNVRPKGTPKLVLVDGLPNNAGMNLHDLPFSLLWDNDKSEDQISFDGNLLCEFPPRWNHIAGIRLGFSNDAFCLNKRHQIFQPVNSSVDARARQIALSGTDLRDPTPFRLELLGDRVLSQRWLAYFSSRANSEWKTLWQDDAHFLHEVFKVVFESAAGNAFEIVDCFGSYIIGPKSVQRRDDLHHAFLPSPGNRWMLKVENE